VQALVVVVRKIKRIHSLYVEKHLDQILIFVLLLLVVWLASMHYVLMKKHDKKVRMDYNIWLLSKMRDDLLERELEDTNECCWV
jgi:hypothetical protein